MHPQWTTVLKPLFLFVVMMISATSAFGQATLPPAAWQTLSLPYYSIKGDWDSRLTLNNSFSQSLTVSLTLYSLDGAALPLPDFELEPGQILRPLLSDLARQAGAGGRFEEGSIQLRYYGIPNALGPQVAVYDSQHGLSFDLEPAGGFKSATLEGLWWSPSNQAPNSETESTSAFFSLSNTTDQSLSVNLEVGWHGAVFSAPPISISSHQTVVMEINKLLDSLGIHSQGIERGGLSLRHSGAPGAVVAHGVVLNKSRRFASNLSFVDPAALGSSILEATGLLLGRPDPILRFPPSASFSPILALRNASSASQTVTVTVQYSAGGGFRTQTLPAISLGPREVQLADFSSLLNSLADTPVAGAGLKLEYSGAPGSVVAVLSSVDWTGPTVVDAPLFNVDPKVYKAGNHPFRIDANSDSVAYVKNVGANPTTAILIVRYPGGEYTPELLHLAPGETMAINLRGLRDSRVEDVRHRTLPENLAEGQFIWYPHTGEPLVGRVVLIDRAGGIASNFSCSNCCSANFDHLEHFPSSITGLVGGSQPMTVNEWDRDSCSQALYGPYNVTSLCSYSSSNTAVATVNGSGVVSLVGVGSTTANMVYPFAQTTRWDGFDCTTDVMPVSDSCVVEVKCNATFAVTDQTGKTCDGTTVYHAGFAVGGNDYPHFTRIVVSTDTDNTIVIELLGRPYTDSSGLCPSGESCYKQDYKAHSYPQSPSGNILWNVTIYCDNHTTPDIEARVYQPVTCK